MPNKASVVSVRQDFERDGYEVMYAGKLWFFTQELLDDMAIIQGSFKQLLAPRAAMSGGQGILGQIVASQKQSAQQQQLQTQNMQLNVSPYGAVSRLFGSTSAEEYPTICLIGTYRVIHTDDWYMLELPDKTRPVAWKSIPSRSLLAAAIKQVRQHRLRMNARDDYGSLLGVRAFKLTGNYLLQSPSQNTIWTEDHLTTSNWDEGEVVRGLAGIHAAWPPMSFASRPLIDTIADVGVIASVRASGRFVAGKEGWRAEKVIVDTVYLPSHILTHWRIIKRLTKQYPNISFEEEPWALERLSKSGKSNRKKSLLDYLKPSL